jgi:hypothetical protein
LRSGAKRLRPEMRINEGAALTSLQAALLLSDESDAGRCTPKRREADPETHAEEPPCPSDSS